MVPKTPYITHPSASTCVIMIQSLLQRNILQVLHHDLTHLSNYPSTIFCWGPGFLHVSSSWPWALFLSSSSALVAIILDWFHYHPPDNHLTSFPHTLWSLSPLYHKHLCVLAPGLMLFDQPQDHSYQSCTLLLMSHPWSHQVSHSSLRAPLQPSWFNERLVHLLSHASALITSKYSTFLCPTFPHN